MRYVARGTALKLYCRVFKHKRSRFIRVTPNATGISSDCQSRLLRLEAAVRIVAVAACHGAFEHFVVKRLRELRFCFVVAAHAQLRLALLEHPYRTLIGTIARNSPDKCN